MELNYQDHYWVFHTCLTSDSKKAIVGITHCFSKVCQGCASGNGGDRRTFDGRSREGFVRSC
ncbi:hypothetical protein SynRS9902_00775 [Synechococcus sp. RS9902]|nr:hypothetical protein SynRS9902_00775 [Synechococcus sp. RS9902]